MECVPLYGAATRRYLQARVSRYDDVGDSDSDEIAFTLDASDVAVVPVRPTAADVRTMTLMDGRITEAISGNPGLAAFALINLASTNPRQPAAEGTRRVLERGCSAMAVAGPTLCELVAFQRAFAVGRTVEEYDTRAGKAAAELAALYQVMFGESITRTRSGQAARASYIRRHKRI